MKAPTFVTKGSLTRWAAKLTYPTGCRHRLKDPAICEICRWLWEKRVARVRQGIIAKLVEFERRDDEIAAELKEARQEIALEKGGDAA